MDKFGNVKLNQRRDIMNMYLGGSLKGSVIILGLLKLNSELIFSKLREYDTSNGYPNNLYIDVSSNQIGYLLNNLDINSMRIPMTEVNISGDQDKKTTKNNLRILEIATMNTQVIAVNDEDGVQLNCPMYAAIKKDKTPNSIRIVFSKYFLEYIDITDNFYFVNLDLVNSFKSKHTFGLYDKLADVAQRNWKSLKIASGAIPYILNIPSRSSSSNINRTINTTIDDMNTVLPGLNLSVNAIYTFDNTLYKDVLSSYEFTYNTNTIKKLTKYVEIEKG